MSNFIHGDNLEHKIRAERNPKNKRLLDEIWNEYKDFINQPKFKKEGGNQYGFTAQSQLHSSVLEEFMF